MLRLAPLALLALTLPLSAQRAEIPWVVNPEVLVLSSSDRPILLYFNRIEDLRCRRMTQWTFTDPLVIEAMQRFTAVAVDVDVRPAIAEHYGVEEVPALVLVTPEDAVIARHTGPMQPDALLRWLGETMGPAPSPPPPPAQTPAEPSPEGVADPFLARPAPAPLPPGLRAPAPPAQGLQFTPPRHEPPSVARAGEDLPIQIFVPAGADSVTLHHRTPGDTVFTDIAMTPNTAELFYAVIPGEAVVLQGVEYYISVVRGNQSLTVPPEGPGRAYRVRVQ